MKDLLYLPHTSTKRLKFKGNHKSLHTPIAYLLSPRWSKQGSIDWNAFLSCFKQVPDQFTFLVVRVEEKRERAKPVNHHLTSRLCKSKAGSASNLQFG